MTEQTVFIVDDDIAVRDSIQELVESVGLRAKSFASANAFLEAFKPDSPGCLVVDVRMAEMSGLVLLEKLRALDAAIPAIVITGHGDVPMAVSALKDGAVDFIQKPCRDQMLLDSINQALSVDGARRSALTDQGAIDKRLASLTRREREVLDQLLDGKTSKQIAGDLDISPRTVEAHRQNLLRKMGVHSAKELLLQRITRDKENP